MNEGTSNCAKICLLGNSGVGKTSIMNRWLSKPMDVVYQCTAGCSYEIKAITIRGQLFHIQLMDTAGQETYRALTPIYIRGSAAVICVYSITDAGSFDNLNSWVDHAKEIAPLAPILIFGNKSDLGNKRIVEMEDAEQYCRSNSFSFVEGSAKTGEGIDRAFEEVIEKWMEAGRPYDERMDLTQQEKKAGCC
jgi:small GTP-binding protein